MLAGAAPMVARGRLAALFDGGPKLILLPGVAAPEVLALPGLTLWEARLQGGLPWLQPWGAEEAAAEGLPLPAAPGGVLALVTPAPEAAAALRDWWERAAPQAVPPLLLAADGAAALPGLAAHAVAALAASAQAAAAARQALVALRGEHEALRLAQARLRQASAQLQPPAPPVLVAATMPAESGEAVAAAEGQLALGQSLGVKLEGLAAIALHLRQAALGPAGLLRLRLLGAESGRILGAWRVPGEALAEGWLTLDLPEPVGPLRETAWLEVRAALGPGDRLALSLAGEPAGPGGAVAVAGGPPQERALALALWTALPGRRLVQAAWWDDEAIRLPAPPAGAPVELPQQIWQAARLAEGRVERVAIGREAARLVASLGPGERALVVLPGVPLHGLDLLRAELVVALGDAAWLDAALWLQPAGREITAVADLSTTAPGAGWSGWHAGQSGEAECRPVLTLPPETSRQAVVALVLRNRNTAPEAVLQVEIARLAGIRRVQPPPGAIPETIRQAAPPRPVSQAPEAPAAARVRLMECYRSEGGGYRHLDLLLEAVQAGAQSWPRLRCKLALNGKQPLLEFRQRPDWPVVFERWPASTPVDAAGPYLHLPETRLTGGFARELATERDRAALLAVLRLLPAAVATAARDATTDPEEYERWIGAARQLAATASRTEAVAAA
ncbi:DUF6212 domain-containing protein [Roseicella sp. DB1501]|uniref:DUF6212 domain-containing protein n=1 Tax=Roseicella sp. DB1501 TaxID=2730925 RepID=UPI0014924C9E|nr:DUF6212 domain-containing protein [Roseicella sp. DB1501]NOG73409.1 hypothetical protein [Roseicella sp. DB1501]